MMKSQETKVSNSSKPEISLTQRCPNSNFTKQHQTAIPLLISNEMRTNQSSALAILNCALQDTHKTEASKHVCMADYFQARTVVPTNIPNNTFERLIISHGPLHSRSIERRALHCGRQLPAQIRLLGLRTSQLVPLPVRHWHDTVSQQPKVPPLHHGGAIR